MFRRSRDERDRADARPLASTCRNLRRAAVVAAVALATTVLPSSAFGAAKGIETEISWGGVSSSVQSQDASAMRDLGVSWTRITLSWHDAEPSKGSLSSTYLSSIDNAINLAHQSGANVILDIYQSPQWASGSSNPDAPPASNKDYADFVWKMAYRYAGQISAYEIWNEENLGRFWGGSPNPGVYADMLKQAYWSVKSADGRGKVVFGGMSENDWQFLDAAYAAMPDLGNYFDYMGVHPYAPNTSPDYVGIQDGHITKDSFAGYREVRRVMLAHGTDKPLYFTEMGWATTSQANMGVSQQQQADYTKLAWKCMQQDPYVEVGILYELRNNFWAGDADDWEDQLGLMTTNWTPKPAYGAFKSVDPSQGGCTYHDINGTPLGSGTELVHPAAPAAPAPAPATQKSTAAKAPTILLKVKTASSRSKAAHAKAASSTKRLATGVSFKVFGQVVGAKGGQLVLTFQRRVHGKWHKVYVKKPQVGSNGRFTTKQLKALQSGTWRVQGQYKAASQPAKSKFVYFKV